MWVLSTSKRRRKNSGRYKSSALPTELPSYRLICTWGYNRFDILPAGSAQTSLLHGGETVRLIKTFSTVFTEGVPFGTPSVVFVEIAGVVEVIIPTMAALNASSGIHQLGDIISSVKQYFNPNLKIRGFVFTRFVPRFKISKQIGDIANLLTDLLDTKMFSTYIRQSVNAPEATYMRKGLVDYNPTSKVVKDNEAFVSELLSDWKH